MTCFGSNVGHLQVVIRLDQLYWSAWSILGEFWGGGWVLVLPKGTMVPFFKVVLSSEICRAHFWYVNGYCTYVVT